MRTITVEYNIYEYDELSDKAKDKVKETIISWREPEHYREFVIDDLKHLFPNSDLDVQFSLSYCQGDGLNIYGKLDADDILYNIDLKFENGLLEKYKDYLDENMTNDISRYANDCGKIILPENTRYCYCIADRCYVGSDWAYELEDNEEENINSMALFKLERLVQNVFSDICKHYEELGYEWFYEISDEECRDYGYEYYEDGSIYN